MGDIDFEAEGLLEGVEGEGRSARLRLLEELSGQGIAFDDLRRAVDEDRLALVAVERFLGGGSGERFTLAEVSERAAIDPDFLKRQWRALGMALGDEDAAVYTEQDIEAAGRVQQLLDAGVPGDEVLEIGRLLGMTMSQLAAAGRRVVADTFTHEGDTEYDAAHRLLGAAQGLMPLLGESLPYVLGLHLREQIRHDAFGVAELAAGTLAADEVTVCFADMVGFTQLGETLEPEALGGVTGRLGELAAEVVEPPVRLVKLLGDAAMLAGPVPEAVVAASLELVEAAADEGNDFPLLRAGIASGPAIARAGDWYGRPVNLASRITAIARPGSVLASEAVRDQLEDRFAWSFAGERRLKGIDGRVKLFRCRRAPAE